MRRELAIGVIIAGLCLLGALGNHLWFMSQINKTMAGVEKITKEVTSNPFQDVKGGTTLRYTLATSHAPLRISLLSTGVIVGVAFGFLGFALFDMGFTGAAKLNAEAKGARVLLENAAPGLVVLVVAAMLIGVSVIQPVTIEYTPTPVSSTSK